MNVKIGRNGLKTKTKIHNAMKKTVKVSSTIQLTESQLELLKKVKRECDANECYEEMQDEEMEDMQYLCEHTLVESIVGEQFFITNFGEQALL